MKETYNDIDIDMKEAELMVSGTDKEIEIFEWACRKINEEKQRLEKEYHDRLWWYRLGQKFAASFLFAAVGYMLLIK